jgi:serine/threonine-protein kinase HipA
MNVAEVKILNELVGAVAWDEKIGLASFEYEPKFKKLGWELAPLKIPINSPSNVINFPELRRNKNSEFDNFKGLPG